MTPRSKNNVFKEEAKKIALSTNDKKIPSIESIETNAL